jgi:ParB family chromosome partitioning protein
MRNLFLKSGEEAMQTTTNHIEVPLNKLVLWEGNVRKTGIEAGLDELASSISAHGLLNPLTIRKAPKGRFAVIAGQRRYLALKKLAQAGSISKTANVSCHMQAEEADPSELSLAENVVRVAMHPADQFEAWRDLIDKGHGVPEIAARFGVPDTTVRKRLALARVSPRIFDLYRAGTLDLETLQAFTVTDDHALQEAVWENLPDWRRDPRSIRHALTESDVPSTDRRVRFVGLDPYEAAGGAVRRDLFDPRGGGFVSDIALLDRLAREKLEAVAATVQAEGWTWTEARLSFDWEDRSAFGQAEPVQVPLPDVLQEEAEALQAEHEALSDSDDDEEEAAASERIEAIGQRLAEIEALAEVWTDEVKAHSGCVVYLDYHGSVEIERGLIRQQDVPEPAASEESHQGDEERETVDAKPALPASLIEELSAQKTAALRIELARSPDIALALVVHAFASSTFYHTGRGVLKASITSRSLRPSIREHESCSGMLALNAESERIGDLLPGDHAALFDFCLKAEQHVLLDVLAVAAAHGLDAVESNSDPNRDGAAQANALASALGLDMRSWYRPSAAGYFGRISKAAILNDLADARQAPHAPSWLKMKKAELAGIAEREAESAGWLPAMLR